MHCQKLLFSIILFENTVLLNLCSGMQLRSATVEKTAGIFTKRIWQPYYFVSLITNLHELICDFNFFNGNLFLFQHQQEMNDITSLQTKISCWLYIKLACQTKTKERKQNTKSENVRGFHPAGTRSLSCKCHINIQNLRNENTIMANDSATIFFFSFFFFIFSNTMKYEEWGT